MRWAWKDVKKVKKTHEEKILEPAVKNLSDVRESNKELSSTQLESIIRSVIAHQTKDENHRASLEEKEALMEIISDNETFFTKVICFKHILENFESNHKYFENGLSLMKNNKLKNNNLLNFAKTRNERIDKGDEFSKMIFKT